MTDLLTPTRKQVADWAILLIVLSIFGCAEKHAQTRGMELSPEEKLKQELSWSIQTLKSKYFEGEAVWVKISPHVTHNIDSLASAYRGLKGKNANLQYDGGQIRVFRNNIEITDSLRDLSDAPEPRNIPFNTESIHRLQWYAQFLMEGTYSVFVERVVQSDTVEFEIQPTPDSLFTLRFILLDDLGHEFTPQFPTPIRVNAPRSTKEAWEAYLRRLSNLPRGYPYRPEGLRAAIAALRSLGGELNLNECRAITHGFIELSNEEPFNHSEIAWLARSWVSELDDSVKTAESARLTSLIPDTAFTNVFLGIRPYIPIPVVTHPIFPQQVQ